MPCRYRSAEFQLPAGIGSRKSRDCRIPKIRFVLSLLQLLSPWNQHSQNLGFHGWESELKRSRKTRWDQMGQGWRGEPGNGRGGIDGMKGWGERTTREGSRSWNDPTNPSQAVPAGAPIPRDAVHPSGDGQGLRSATKNPEQRHCSATGEEPRGDS